MKYHLSYRYPFLVVIFTILSTFIAWAQTDDELTLHLRRNFGYSSGTGKIQGDFTIRAEGPDDLQRVVFYIDDQVVGEVNESPFHLKFNTDSYPLGVHVLRAIGYTVDGREIHSPEQLREFVSAEASWRAAGRIALPILGITFGVILIAFLLPILLGRGKGSLPPGTPRNYGMFGGTICPRCNRPFARHIWGLNLVVGKLDRCPYCGKWSLARHTPIEILRAAEAAELEGIEGRERAETPLTDEERLRKELEDSRFQDL
ncbi:MAG: Ig-like domain-containing protein [Anaerolineales bacterium]|jgi:hypothetical protein